MHLLFFSDITWEHLYQRPQQLANYLGRHWPVLWIEPATLGSPRKWLPVRKHEHLHVLSLPQFPHNARNAHVRGISRFLSTVPGLRGLLCSIQHFLLRRAMKHLDIEHQTFGAVVENFQFASLIEHIRPSVVLFDYIDDAFGFADYPAYVREEWRKTIGLATALTATSSFLKAQLERERSLTVHLVENGVDTSLYQSDAPPPRPPDLPAADRPIIIYVGTVSRWFDFELLRSALRHLPDYNFVIVGPVHPDVGQRLTEMHDFTNLSVLGSRAHTAIPAYLRVSTVGMIPFVRNRLTEGVNPVKLYEYAAAALPIVTTAFSDDIEQFRDVAFIGRTREEFLGHLATAVAAAQDPGHAARLRAFAVQNDWGMRAGALASLLTQQMEQHKKPQRSS